MQIHDSTSIAEEAHYALFLDIDGTLAAITETPDATVITPEMLATLGRLHRKLGGALGIVSGRNIPSIDRLCAPASYDAAGQHGMEIRLGGKVEFSPHAKPGRMDTIACQLGSLRDFSDDLLIENKGLSIAVHYRKAPELATKVRSALQHLIDTYDPEITLHDGKMVCELRVRGADKGSAIAYLLSQPPFKGKIPIFAGDDVTDEDGFKVVNSLGGISIKVGPGETYAPYRVDSVEGLQHWLECFEQQLEQKKEEA